jgi:RNA polymerase sigma factor (sigma-70 family)
LTPEQRTLAAEYQWNARTLACRTYYRSGQVGDIDEYISVGYMALVHAAAHYNPDLGFRFATLLICALRRALWELRAPRRPKKRLCQLNFCDVHRDDTPVLDPVCRRILPPDRAAANAELLARVKKRLPAIQWNLLYARFIEGETLPAIGERLGVSSQRVDQLIDKALQRARRLVAA